MPAILVTGPNRSGKTSLAAGLVARLHGAGRSAAYCKPFTPDAGADGDLAFAAGVLADALDIAVGPAPGPLAGGIDNAVQAVALLGAEADTVVVEVADGSAPRSSPPP